MSEKQDKIRQRYMGVGLALGVAIGAALGVALKNLALGIGLGPMIIKELSRRRWFGMSIVLASGSVMLTAPAFLSNDVVTPLSQCAACRCANSVFMRVHTPELLRAHVKYFCVAPQFFFR